MIFGGDKCAVLGGDMTKNGVWGHVVRKRFVKTCYDDNRLTLDCRRWYVP